MAAIDYGVLVFKNGEQICKDKLFPIVQIGDFMIECYKIWCDVCFQKRDTMLARFEFTERYDDTDTWIRGYRKSARYRVGPLSMHFKEVFPRVFRIRIDVNGDHYTIIHGFGIDNDPRVWKRCKVEYLGRKGARIVDNEIRRATRKEV